MKNPESGEPRAITADTENTRRQVLSAGALVAVSLAGAALATDARAQQTTSAQPAADQALYYRLGGIFAIAAVVDYFSDQIILDPIAGAHSANPQLREWHTNQLGRLPGLKFMRTLWVAAVSGGPFQYTPTRPGSNTLGLEAAHENLRISPAEFDAVAGVLSRSLDHFHVPAREKGEVLGAFAAHKDEVTKGWRDAQHAH
ncbi:MAG: group 1 truncated hemoglobin [Proteobacteria bacterium]|nr:group 1 truncated hemoglobin [Pseudomonadota bacterium]